MFPIDAVTRLFPTGCDSITISAERAHKALREARRISPHLPDTALQAHLVNPGNTARVEVEYGIGLSRLIPPDDLDGAGGGAMLGAHVHHQESAALYPLE